MRKGDCFEPESVTCSAQGEGGSYCVGAQWLGWPAERVAGVPTEGHVAGWIQPQTPQISDPVAWGEWSRQPGRQKAEQGCVGSLVAPRGCPGRALARENRTQLHPMQNPGLEGCASGPGWGQEGEVAEGDRRRKRCGKPRLAAAMGGQVGASQRRGVGVGCQVFP